MKKRCLESATIALLSGVFFISCSPMAPSIPKVQVIHDTSAVASDNGSDTQQPVKPEPTEVQSLSVLGSLQVFDSDNYRKEVNKRDDGKDGKKLFSVENDQTEKNPLDEFKANKKVEIRVDGVQSDSGEIIVGIQKKGLSPATSANIRVALKTIESKDGIVAEISVPKSMTDDTWKEFKTHLTGMSLVFSQASSTQSK